MMRDAAHEQDALLPLEGAVRDDVDEDEGGGDVLSVSMRMMSGRVSLLEGDELFFTSGDLIDFDKRLQVMISLEWSKSNNELNRVSLKT